MKYCAICRGERRIKLPTWPLMEASPAPELVPEVTFKEFDCPQCVPSVPYRRVRATKAVAEYSPETFARMQNPIQRTLAAKFGEYLLKEGLIKFTTDSLDDFTKPTITVTAHLGVVSADDTERTGAPGEFAYAEGDVPLAAKLERERQARIKRKNGDPDADYTLRPRARGVQVVRDADGNVSADSAAQALNELLADPERTVALPNGVFGRKKTKAELAAEAAKRREDFGGRFSGIDLGDFD